MSDDEPEEKPPQVRPPRTSKAVLGLLAANLAVSGFILFQTMGQSSAHPAAAAAAVPAEGTAPTPDQANQITGPVIPLDPFVINLNEPGPSRYLRIQLQIELRDGAATKSLEKSKQLVRDDILSYLSGLRVADTLGPENKDRIRDALARRVGERLGPQQVNRMIFAEFVVQ